MPTPRRLPAAIACGLALSTALAPSAVGQTPTRPNAPNLDRCIPGNDLVAYVGFDGLHAHQAAWRKTATYRLLNETKLGAMLEDLATDALDKAIAAGPPGEKPKAAEVMALIKAMADDGFAMGLRVRPPEGPAAVLVFRNGAKNGVRAFFERMRKAGMTPETVRTEARGARTLTIHGEGETAGAWWDEGDDLVVAPPPLANANAAIAALEGKVPDATTNPIRAELARLSGHFETPLVAFLDCDKVIPRDPKAKQLGLDGLKRLDYRWGFQGEAIFSVTRVLAPAPRRGILAMLDGPTFDKGSLPTIPAGLSSWTALSISPLALYDKFVGLLKETNPRDAEHIPQMEGMVAQALGVRLKEDFLAPLGPKMVFYADVDSSKFDQLPRAALTAEVRDAAAFAGTLDKIVVFADAQIKAAAERNPQGARGPVEFRKVEGPNAGYRMVLPPGSLPPGMASDIAPTLLVGKGRLALGLTDDEARKALDADARADAKWTPTADYKAPFEGLPRNLVYLSVSDPRATLPAMIASLPQSIAAMNAMIAARNRGGPEFSLNLDPAKVPDAAEIRSRLFPGTIAVAVDAEGIRVFSRESVQGLTSPATLGVAAGLLLPAVQATREAARRSQCTNNLKLIGLAMHNFHDVNGRFPSAAIVDKDGKPLLSWRVAILPFLAEQPLYNEFHLDEPWDSAHNKPLIARMPTTFACPSRSKPEPGATTYRAFVGGGALFDLTTPHTLADVTDGTSATLMVVEAAGAVPWTKPDSDLPFDPEADPSLYGAGSSHPGGFNALLADGSVRFISATIDKLVFKHLITRAGGEVVQIP